MWDPARGSPGTSAMLPAPTGAGELVAGASARAGTRTGVLERRALPRSSRRCGPPSSSSRKNSGSLALADAQARSRSHRGKAGRVGRPYHANPEASGEPALKAKAQVTRLANNAPAAVPMHERRGGCRRVAPTSSAFALAQL
jgi:hypothetical protein